MFRRIRSNTVLRIEKEFCKTIQVDYSLRPKSSGKSQVNDEEHNKEIQQKQTRWLSVMQKQPPTNENLVQTITEQIFSTATQIDSYKCHAFVCAVVSLFKNFSYSSDLHGRSITVERPICSSAGQQLTLD
jgi:hypothetical protein